VKYSFFIVKETYYQASNYKLSFFILSRSLQKFTLLSLIFFSQITAAQIKSDSTSIHLLNKRAFSVYLYRPDSGIVLANQTLKLATEQKLKYEIGYSEYVLSKANWAKANYRLSTQHGFEALKIFENSVYTDEWVSSLLSLARTFIDLRNITVARNFLAKAISLAGKSSNANILADTYREFSLLLLNQHQYDSAILFSDKAAAIYEKEKDTLSTSVVYGRKARIYYELKDYKRSLYYNKKSLILDYLVNNRRALGVSYFIAAQIADKTNKQDSAIYFLSKSLKLNEEIGNIGTLIKSHELMANIYIQKGKSEIATSELKLASQLKDTLYNLEKNGQIQEMQSIYELETKDKTIKLLEQENVITNQRRAGDRLLLICLLICIALLFALILVLWRIRIIQAKANSSLALTNKAIEQQKEEIEVQAESLQQLNLLKSKLFSVISHDLRGPLSNLLGLLELYNSKVMSQSEFVSVSEKLKTNLTVTQRTLENLLQWSLSQMEGIKTEFKPIEIHLLLGDVTNLLKETAVEKNIFIETTSTEQLHVSIDADQIQLVLRNLIHNAIKFSKPNSKILLSATPEGNHCKVSVIDFGVGMTEEEISLVTKDGFHFSKSGTKQEKGTGLGLVLCKEFIQRHGGSLLIKSSAGGTTEISFTLPLHLN